MERTDRVLTRTRPFALEDPQPIQQPTTSSEGWLLVVVTMIAIVIVKAIVIAMGTASISI